MQPVFILVPALAVIIVLRRVNAMAAGFLGIAVSLGIGAWGWTEFNAGGGVAFGSFRLSLPQFLGVIAVWLAFECWGTYQAFKKRRPKVGT